MYIEYKTITSPLDADALNELGRQGWELQRATYFVESSSATPKWCTAPAESGCCLLKKKHSKPFFKAGPTRQEKSRTLIVPLKNSKRKESHQATLIEGPASVEALSTSETSLTIMWVVYDGKGSAQPKGASPALPFELRANSRLVAYILNCHDQPSGESATVRASWSC